MKKVILGTMLALGLCATANAAWYATAVSTTAYGYGASNSREAAIDRALYECNMRTALGSYCYVTEVYWQ